MIALLDIFWKLVEETKSAEVPIDTPADIPAEPKEPDQLSFKGAKEYEALSISLSKELGLVHGDNKSSELKQFLRAEGMHCYRTAAVRDYLVAKNGGKKFNLYPARDSDRNYYATTGNLWATGGLWKGCTVNNENGQVLPAYRSRVPYPVLLTMKKLVDKFGDDVHFYIAAISDDPFLAVCLGDSHLHFIERWDEPEFREN